MPTLSDRLVKEQSGVPEGMEPATPTQTIQAPVQRPALNGLEPTGTGFTRCPLPPIYTQNPDNLRTWFNGGKVPQIRIYPQQLKGNS